MKAKPQIRQVLSCAQCSCVLTVEVVAEAPVAIKKSNEPYDEQELQVWDATEIAFMMQMVCDTCHCTQMPLSVLCYSGTNDWSNSLVTTHCYLTAADLEVQGLDKYQTNTTRACCCCSPCKSS